jgi:predicted ester cyclase
MDRVWTAGDTDAVDEYLASAYTIYSDPGDPGDGQTLDRDTFKQRLVSSRRPFPDLRFDLEEFVEEGNRVALGWTMRGTNTGSVGDRAPSGRPIAVHGLTIYYFADRRITGHRQVVDRLSVVQQLGLIG